MIALKESLLTSTKSKVRNMPKTIIKAQLEGLGFPDYEETCDDGWAWICPEVIERNESNILKLTNRRKTYCGFWVEMIPAKMGPYEDGSYKETYMVTIDAITDHTGNMPWMGSNELLSFVCDKDKKKVYEFFQMFALNVDEMIRDFVKLGEDYEYEEAYKTFMKKYGK